MSRLLILVAMIGIVARGVIPAGWMPTGERAFAIAICTGVDTHTVWLDSKGKLHKQDPDRQPVPDSEPCAFTALAMAVGLPDAFVVSAALGGDQESHVVPGHRATVGRGLAAPPPPATGPPLLS
jgi:hypothetical protein